MEKLDSDRRSQKGTRTAAETYIRGHRSEVVLAVERGPPVD